MADDDEGLEQIETETVTGNDEVNDESIVPIDVEGVLRGDDVGSQGHTRERES
jgi:hypothetical protein